MEQLQENLEEYDKLQSLTSERDHILFVSLTSERETISLFHNLLPPKYIPLPGLR